MTNKVYVLRMAQSNYFKVGHTTNSVESRRQALQTGNPQQLDVYAVIETDKAYEFEGRLHRDLFSHKTNGGDEWFEIEPIELDKHIKKLLGGFNHDWPTRYYDKESQVRGLHTYNVRPLPGGQQDSIASGRQDVLLARNPAVVSASSERVVIPKRQELDVCRQDDWGTRIQELGKRTAGVRDD